MKYIIFERPDGLEHLVIFDEITNHVDMKNQINLPVIGAGKVNFCLNKDGEVEPFAIHQSVTLGLNFSKEKSQEDSYLIKRALNFRG